MRKVSRDLVHSGQEKVPKAVAFEPVPARKPVTKKLREQIRVLRQGSHAIPYVAGRKNVKVAPETARTATIIGHRYNRAYVQGRLRRTRLVLRARRVLLQSGKKSG